MALRTAKITVTLRDARGHIGKVGTYVTYDDTVAGSGDASAGHGEDFQTQVLALSNAVLVNATGPGGKSPAPNQYGATSVYQNAEDKLRIRVLAADNTIHTFNIPAPLLADFEADAETAKGSAIAAFIALITGAAVATSQFTTRAGSPYVASLGGSLVRKKFQRKLTIYDKSANLDEPEE